MDIEEFMSSDMYVLVFSVAVHTLQRYCAIRRFAGILPSVAKSLFKAADRDGSKELELNELLQVAFPECTKDIIADMLQYCEYLDDKKNRALRQVEQRLKQLAEELDG